MANDLPIEQVMENLKIHPHMNPTKGHMKDGNGCPSDATSCISSTGDASGSVKEGEADGEPLTMPYSPNNYYSYYYPGYEGYPGAIEGQGYYVSGDGLEMQYPVMVDDNGNLLCIIPGGYNPYTQYLPMATIGVDGQYINQPPSQLSPIFSPPIASPGYFPTHSPYGSELVSPTYMWNPSYIVGDGYPNGYSKVLDTPISKPNLFSSGYNNTRASSKPTSEFKNAIANKGPLPELEISSKYSTRSQPKGLSKPTQHGSATQPDSGQAKSNVQFTKFPSNHHNKGGLLNPKGHVNVKPTAQNGYENLKTLSNNAPVTKGDTTTSLDVDLNNNENSSTSLVKPELYNLHEFPTKYEHAIFFVIKSYSEDDIHKSIKYNVWASTPNGNKRLDSVYQEAQEKVSKCPVFLFFSVNASGQFCGVAEMLGRVDFNKSMDFWQQDKWNGYIPVKWHIIKDVPNPQLRHIILENNENKPVTNSRDTQEVRFPQGIEMLNIFKKYVSKTSILDDFEFYESRQKVMQEKRIRPSTFRYDAVQQKVNELNRGLQVTAVPAIKKIDEIQVGENALG